MSAVVFLGDFNVDLILDGLEAPPALDREIGCASFDVVMGASSCIAAAAFARLGGLAAICSLSGDDEFGAFMRARLAEAGVYTELVGRHPEMKTGVTVNLVQGLKRSQVTYPGAMGQFSAAHVPAALYSELAHLHVSGMYQLKGLLPHLAAIVQKASGNGATISMDCQWDPTERWEHLDAWLPFMDWLIVNEQEARSITGRSGPAEALLALASRTRCPVVKAGEAGSWVAVDGKALLVPAFRVDVVDTIGAGDNFDAAFLFALLEKGMALRDAARFANAAAARSCTFRGGTDARSSFQDITHFMETRA